MSQSFFRLCVGASISLACVSCGTTEVTRKFGPEDLETLGAIVMENMRKADGEWMKASDDGGELPRIAVLDIKNDTDAPGLNKEPFFDLIETELHKMGRFILVDRRERDAIVDEGGSQQSRTFDNAEAVRFGKLLGAQYLLWGSVGLTKAPTNDGMLQKTYNLGIKVTSVEKGSIVYRDNAKLPPRTVN